MKIDINKKYYYRNGEPARIICVDAPGDQPVISLDGSGDTLKHKATGQFFLSNDESSLDLIEVREPREWVLSVKPGTLKVSEIYEDEGPLDLHGWERVRVREIID
jgi:hypothetical protein